MCVTYLIFFKVANFVVFDIDNWIPSIGIFSYIFNAIFYFVFGSLFLFACSLKNLYINLYIFSWQNAYFLNIL